MKRCFKKSMAILLALLMTLSTMSVMAMAADTEETDEQGFIDAVVTEPIDIEEPSIATYATSASGRCGDNLTWSLSDINSNGTLTISGSGDMYDYNILNSYYAPWSSYLTAITKIVISTGVTSIGVDAFYFCTNLTSITIPNSVTSIGMAAFSACLSLTSVTIPDSVTSIGFSAFCDCRSLTSITIPDSVTSIDGNAFSGCSSLTSIIIPDGITSINEDTFSFCTSLTSITIPNSVTSIGPEAFWECTSLTSITIPDSVTSIGYLAFESCTSLTSIKIPDGVATIDDGTFWGCTSLKSITIPDSVTSIGEYAFYGCSSLTDVYYSGSKSDWNKITIEEENDPLLNATIHYYTFSVPDDEWSFKNYTVDYVPLTYEDYYALTYDSEDNAKKLIEKIYQNHAGQCYGMAATSVLIAQEDLSLDAASSSISTLYEAQKETKSESLIGYYFLTQFSKSVYTAEEDFKSKPVKSQLSIIESQEEPFVLNFGYYDCNGDYWGHSIVGYGIEYGNWTKNGTTYTARVLTYDSNCPYSYSESVREDSYLYFDTSFGAWEVPNYVDITTSGFLFWKSQDYEHPKGASSKNESAFLSLACSDASILNCFDIEQARGEAMVLLSQNAGSSGPSLTVDDDRYYNEVIPDNSDELLEVFPISGYVAGSTDLSPLMVNISDVTKLSFGAAWSNNPIDISALFENTYVSVTADSYKTVNMNVDGDAQLTEYNGNYSMNITLNDSPITMYTFDISGNGSGSIAAKVTDNGLIIEGDDLTDVTISGLNDEVTSEITFSTGQDSVLVTDDGNDTLIIMADENNDGNYNVEIGRGENYYGQFVEIDGEWYYSENGYIDSEYNNVVYGAVDGTFGWWYVVGGKVQFNYTGVANYANDYGWWYIKNGKVDFTFTGFAKNNNGWWYVTNGQVNFAYNTVMQGTVNGVSGWYEVIGGQVQTNHTGVSNVSNEYGWWYVRNGMVDFGKTGIEKNNYGWWRVVDGKVDFNCTGIEQNDYGWWRIVGGQVDFGCNSVVQNAYGWWYIVGGQVQFGYTGVANYSNAYGWWYIRNGQVDFGKTGVEPNNYGWWRVVNGQVDFGCNSVEQNDYGWWYLVGGQVQFGYTGVANYANANGWWYINGGKVDFSKTSVEPNAYGWWRVEGGKVNFSYTGWARNSYGTWYCVNGKVDFSRS